MKKALILLFLIVCISTFSQEVKISTEKAVVNGKKYYIHTVEKNQTLYSICKAYYVFQKDVEDANKGITIDIKEGQTIKIPVTKENENLLVDKTFSYKIMPGDTKYSICKKYGINIEEFNNLNKESANTNDLKVGQIVYLPDLTGMRINENNVDTSRFFCHIVNKGETIFSLSRTYSINKDEIIRNNPKLQERNLLQVGEMVLIPKENEYLLSRNEMILDSLSKINKKRAANDSINRMSFNACDSINWYKDKKEIKIAILLPFDKEINIRNIYDKDKKNKDITKLSKEIVSFYNGCLAALDNFNGKDIKITINTYDIGKKNEVLNKIIDDKLLHNCDLIIGPAFRSQAELLNEALFNQKIPIILPFTNDSDILRKYPNNIMLSPSDYQIRKTISDYLSTIKQKNIIIIQGSDSESIKNASELQRLLKKDSLINNKIRIIKYEGTDFSKILDKDGKNFIISMISSEVTINSMFTKLYAFLKYDITFIGEDYFLDYETIDPAYYLQLNYTYFSHTNYNNDSENVKKFISNYRKTFNSEPTNYSFDGYDITNLFIDNLMKYGNQCFDCLKNSFKYKGISGNLQFSNAKQFGKNSYTNRAVYLYGIQQDYSFNLIFSYIEN